MKYLLGLKTPEDSYLQHFHNKWNFAKLWRKKSRLGTWNFRRIIIPQKSPTVVVQQIKIPAWAIKKRGDEWLLAKFYLCSICSQNLNECSLARAPQIFALLASSQSKFFISARARKKIAVLGMLANARKDHSSPLKSNPPREVNAQFIFDVFA